MIKKPIFSILITIFKRYTDFQSVIFENVNIHMIYTTIKKVDKVNYSLKCRYGSDLQESER